MHSTPAKVFVLPVLKAAVVQQAASASVKDLPWQIHPHRNQTKEKYRYVLKISSMEGRTLSLVYDLMNFMHLPCQNGDTLRVCLTVRICTWMDSKPSHVMADGWERRGAVEQGTPCVLFRLGNIGPDLPIELILPIYKNHRYNEDL